MRNFLRKRVNEGKGLHLVNWDMVARSTGVLYRCRELKERETRSIG